MSKNSKNSTSTAKRRRTYTDEQRARNAAYLRRYRAEHPDAARRWRDAYILRRADILRRAEKLRAQMEDAEMTEDAKIALMEAETEDVKIALMEAEAEDAKIEMMEAEAMGISKPIYWKPEVWKPEVKGGADRG